MNKQEVLATYHDALVELCLAPWEMRINAGGAMVLYDLRAGTEDLDVDVSHEVYIALLARGYTETKDGDFRYITILDCVDVHDGGNDIEGDFYGCAFLPSLVDLLAFKRSLNRPKDQADINALEQRLAIIAM